MLAVQKLPAPVDLKGLALGAPQELTDGMQRACVAPAAHLRVLQREEGEDRHLL